MVRSGGQVVARQYMWSCCHKTGNVVRLSQDKAGGQVVIRQMRWSDCQKAGQVVRLSEDRWGYI